MKKAVSIVLCFCFLFSLMASALADDFTLRSGIKFGDTIDDIVAKETTLTRESEDSSKFTGKISGYDEAVCEFQFDDDGKLNDMIYMFNNSCTSRETANDVYKVLCDGLKRKYGTPLGNTDGSCYIITGSAVTKITLASYLLGALGCDVEYVDYDEWIVDCDGYHVKIDLDEYYLRDTKYNYTYSVYLSYHMFTDEDLENAQNEKKQEREEVDSDL